MNKEISSIVKSGKLFLISGPCVIESESLCFEVADHLAKLSEKYNLPIVFKASFTKANRLSAGSFTGPGIDEGLRILQKIKEQTGLPILTDVHDTTQPLPVAEVADILQIPAFLCRQTDLLVAATETGKWVNLKKGQFLAPEDMSKLASKVNSDKVMLTERGTTFGYRNLVVDFRSFIIMKESGHPVIFDASHSLQLPGGGGNVSTGQPQFIEPLAKAAAAIGVDGLFVETHPNPNEALSDAGAMLPLSEIESLIGSVLKARGTPENN